MEESTDGVVTVALPARTKGFESHAWGVLQRPGLHAAVPEQCLSRRLTRQRNSQVPATSAESPSNAPKAAKFCGCVVQSKLPRVNIVYDTALEPFAFVRHTRIRGVGRGLFACRPLPRQTVVCEYSGLMVKPSDNICPVSGKSFFNQYIWGRGEEKRHDEPLKAGSPRQSVRRVGKENNGPEESDCFWEYDIDAANIGCGSRFVNHFRGISERPNLRTQVVLGEGEGRWHVLFKTLRPVAKGEQLTVDYGPCFDEFDLFSAAAQPVRSAANRRKRSSR